jgi:hypothetical protein
MGLCKRHDQPDHRERTRNDWLEMMRRRLEEFSLHADQHQKGAALLSIYFNGGGSLSMPCSSFSITDDNAIKALTPSREVIFFPLARVRNYALTPLAPLTENEEGEDETSGEESPDEDAS